MHHQDGPRTGCGLTANFVILSLFLQINKIPFLSLSTKILFYCPLKLHNERAKLVRRSLRLPDSPVTPSLSFPATKRERGDIKKVEPKDTPTLTWLSAGLPSGWENLSDASSWGNSTLCAGGGPDACGTPSHWSRNCDLVHDL